MKDKLIQLNTMFLGNWNAIFDGIRNKLLLGDKKIKNQTPWQLLQFKTINDDNFPRRIREVIMPPFVFFYEGNWNLINKMLFGIHGKLNNDQFKSLWINLNKCFIFSENDYSEEIENYLIKNKIQHIVVFDKLIDREIKDEKMQLFISEYYTKITNPTVGQDASRIVLGLGTKNIFINDAITNAREIAYFDTYKPNITLLWTNENFEAKYSKLSKLYKNVALNIVEDLNVWFSKK